jgi:hypothetical protein
MKNEGSRSGILALCLALCLAIASALPAAALADPMAPLSISVAPGLSWPAWDPNLFDLGASTTASANFRIAATPLVLGPEFGYTYQPIKDTSTALSLLSFGAAATLDFKLAPWLHVQPFGQGGYFLAFLPGSASQPGRSPFFGGGIGVEFLVGKAFGLDLKGAYQDYYGLYQTATASLAATLRLGLAPSPRTPTQPSLPAKPSPLSGSVQAAATGRGIQFSSLSLDPVFPVLFKFYDDHPIGKVSIKNSGGSPMEDVKVSLFVSQYMDNSKLCATIPLIEPGAEASADLYALFNDKLLGVSEGTKVSAKVSVEYSAAGAAASQERVETIRVFDRNASMWDDNRKAAAFVTSKDPTVLRFSKNVLAMVKDKGSASVNQNLLTAMAFHEATRLYGLTYVTDPSNSYAAVLQDKSAVDFLQFPRQTLDYKGGNCSALSILYSALLESVGVETAFITVPGHIFMAVSLGESPDRARKDFQSPDDLILTGDRSWLPIETTERNAGFLQAWQDAAKEWRENLAKQQAELYPVHEAWTLYEPVGFASDMGNIVLPGKDEVASAYLQELVHYIDKEIFPEVARLQAEIRRSNGAPKAINKLGVLYARYGLNDRAESEFNLALKGGDYPLSLVNLGNLKYLQTKFQEALEYFGRAQAMIPEEPALLLAIARTNHELENYGVAKVAYDKLKSADPSLAARFGYLELKGAEGTRAADISGVKDQVVWGDE